jgi:hypothetical protein
MNGRPDRPGPPEAQITSVRDLADLARSGYGILRKPFSQVDFEVHHTADRPGYFRDNIVLGKKLGFAGRANSSAKSVLMEALASAANGVGVVIGTSTGGDMPFPLRRRADGGGAFNPVVMSEPDRRVFRGTAYPNPAFLFESADTYEGIVSVDPAPRRPRFGQSIAVRDLIREIARVASDVAAAPLLFLQAPAHLPTHSYIGEDVRSRFVASARHSSSLAVRFSIALERPSAQLRAKLTEILGRYCADRRFGLWLIDSRAGYRAGNWFQICVHDSKGQARDLQDQDGAADSSTIEMCVPVTLIGPARIGSTYAIMSFLGQYSNIGVLSAAITTLDDVALIHFQLSVRGVKRSQLKAVNDLIDEHGTLLSRPVDGLRVLHDTLIPSHGDSPDYVRAGRLSERAGDFQSLVGPALPCVVSDRRKRIALWFSWQMEGTGRDLAKPLSHLFQAFHDVGMDLSDDSEGTGGFNIPNLEYLICRDIGNSALRGRGKLGVLEADVRGISGDGIEDAAVKLCVSLEDAWRASISRENIIGVNELTVAWREWWLHHWAAPI